MKWLCSGQSLNFPPERDLQKVVSKGVAEDWRLVSSYWTELKIHLIMAL